MITKEVWFWLIIIGIVIIAAGALVILYTEDNKTLGYIILAGGIVVLLAGIVYAVLKKSRAPIDLGTEDIKLRNTFTDSLSETAQTFNENVDNKMKAFVGGRYENYIKENVNTQGKLLGSATGLLF